MSELPKIVDPPTGVIPRSLRYNTYFPGLPLQATLNMLVAYQPSGDGEDAIAVRRSMDLAYSNLLTSGQREGAHHADVDMVADRDLEQAFSHLREHVGQMEARKVGAEVIDITTRQTA